jgi:hypothetical protein
LPASCLPLNFHFADSAVTLTQGIDVDLGCDMPSVHSPPILDNEGVDPDYRNRKEGQARQFQHHARL